MSDSTVRDQFYDLWSNRLSAEDAKSLQEQIASDSTLQKQYEEDILLFESLSELRIDEIAVPESFASTVEKQVEQRRLNSFRSKVMKAVRLLDDVFKGIGWFSVILVGVPVLCLTACMALLNSSVSTAVARYVSAQQLDEIISTALNLIEGRFGVLVMVFFLSYAVLSLPTRHFRLAAMTGTAAIGVFCIRTAMTTFFSTQDIEAFDASTSSRKDKIVVVEKEAPVDAQLLQRLKSARPAQPLAAGAPPSANIASPEKKEAYDGVVTRFMAPAIGDFIPMQEESREGYRHEELNPKIAVQSQPVSTFGMDVDTGSYANVRRFLRSGNLPPADAVRIEELVNYFPYSYAADSDKPFTPNFEIAPSPINAGHYLLRIGLKARAAVQDRSKGWNLVFLVDTSGSMNEANKLPLVKQSLKVLTDSMRAEDRISIVTYAGNAGLVLPSTSGSEKAKIIAAIDSLDAGGSTNGSAGIDLAYAQAEQNKIAGSVNRVILATDGDFNVGISDFNGLMNLVEKKRKAGVTLTTLGYGTGNYQEQNMEQLADKGNGNYFYIDSFQEARKVLASELTQNMEVVAKDTKLQIEFNPAQVSEYRLIGFENRRLKNEDFTNDKVDAGDVGSGHTVTALYELVLASHPVSGAEVQLRYQEASARPTPVTLAGELAFLKIRAKAPEGDTSTEYAYPVTASMVKSSLDEASGDFKFAAAVAGFGELLKDSKYAGSLQWADVKNLALKGKGEDPFGYRSEFVSLVDAAASLSKR